MKVPIDVKENKAGFILELLRSFSFVKTKIVGVSKAQFIKEFKASVEEVKLAEQGKIKLKTAEQLLDEL